MWIVLLLAAAGVGFALSQSGAGYAVSADCTQIELDKFTDPSSAVQWVEQYVIKPMREALDATEAPEFLDPITGATGTVEKFAPSTVAAYLWRRTVPESCRGVDTPALRRWYFRLLVAVKMQLFAETGDPIFEVTEDELREAGMADGFGIGARIAVSPRLDYTRMTADANRGELHPVTVITGTAFR